MHQEYNACLILQWWKICTTHKHISVNMQGAIVNNSCQQMDLSVRGWFILVLCCTLCCWVLQYTWNQSRKKTIRQWPIFGHFGFDHHYRCMSHFLDSNAKIYIFVRLFFYYYVRCYSILKEKIWELIGDLRVFPLLNLAVRQPSDNMTSEEFHVYWNVYQMISLWCYKISNCFHVSSAGESLIEVATTCAEEYHYWMPIKYSYIWL